MLAGLALGLLALGVGALFGAGAENPPIGTPGGGTKPDVVLPVIDERELDGLSEQARSIIRETEACEAVVLQSEDDLDQALARMRTECHEPAARRMAELNEEGTANEPDNTAESSTTAPGTTAPATTGP